MRRVRTSWHRLFFSAAALAALVFLVPLSSVLAFTIPDTITLSTNSFVQVLRHEEILSWYRSQKQISFNPVQERQFESTVSFCAPFPLWCSGFFSRETRAHFLLRQTLRIVPENIKASIEQFGERAYHEPKDAKLGIIDGKPTVTLPDEPGFQIDTPANVSLVETALRSSTQSELSLSLVGSAVPAKVTKENLEQLGITDLIGTATTNFRGSPKNRIYNINRAIEQFNGIVINQGETFSFVQHLGDVDGEHGYLPELVIKNNKTEPEFGGGICQVSTTVFRTALQSGLKITERRNHAYPVQYYKPYGMDATVYVPRPDLQFVNNTPGTILLIPEIKGTILTFSMYGTSDGRKTTLDGPHILESHPDGSMKTVFTQIVTDKDGQTFINDSFWSNYKSPSLFPHPGAEPIYTSKPKDWSQKQWREYRVIHS